MALIPLQSILEEAGMSHQQLQETPYGSVDGVNVLFTVSHVPLTDSNYDNIIDEDDVTVLVNGNPVSIDDINVDKGIITLSDAPASGSSILISYRYSGTNLKFVRDLRAEVLDMINRKAKRIDPSAPYGQDTCSPTLNAICRIWCAALILTRDYGFNQDTELTSKDGYKRLSLVMGDKNNKGMLQDFLDGGGISGEAIDDADTAGIGSVAVQSEGTLFSKDFGPQRPNSDCEY